jgi:hypothetical protein
MAKKIIADPTVRTPFLTSNGVLLRIESWPDPTMSSSRWDAKVVSYDFNDIRTNVYLSEVTWLVTDISELEHSDESIRNDAFEYFNEDTSKLIKALGGTDDDLNRLKQTILDSRRQVLLHQTQEAL